jgi:hypothetical protein
MRALWYLLDLVYSIRHCVALGLSLLVLAGCDSKPDGQDSTAPVASSQESGGAAALSTNPPIGGEDKGEIIQAEEGETSGSPAVTAVSSPLEISATSNARYLKDVADDLAHLDPRKDGWVGEVINEAVGKRFDELKPLIEAGLTSTDSLGSILSDDFQCHPLRPVGLAVVFVDKAVLVRRPSIDLDSVTSTRRGVEGFSQSLAEMLNVGGKSLGGSESGVEIKAYFKIVGVEADRTSSETRVLFELDLANSEGRSQQNATWICVWHPARERGGLPLLAEIRVVEYEETFSPSTEGPLFVDSTEAVLGQNASYREQLAYGVDHWRERIDWRFTQEVTGPHGMAIGDVNGDDLDDLFFCETGGLPNRLFIQQEDGTLLDVSAASGLDYLEPTSSALIVDLDNDADQDLVLSSGRNLLFFENEGKGTFRRRLIRKSDSVARSLTAIDFDLDGLLDIYVCGYFSMSGDGSGMGRPLPYHDANNGVRNYLLDNVGGWQFDDATSAVGLEENNRRFSYAAAWEDYDNDGDLDLYVANDFGRNNLYRNDGGQFTDVAAEAGVEDISAGMSVSWGDYNSDGLPDLYVGNMFSSAGNRVAYQRRYRSEEKESIRQLFQRHARGNTLFANSGDGTFKDVSLEAGVTMGRWAWGSNFADLNNDGWDDIVVANGLVTSPDDTGDL